MSIEARVDQFVSEFLDTGGSVVLAESLFRHGLTEQAETHALELRAYEATVQNLRQRIKDLQLELLANEEPRPMEQVDGGAA